jgi:ParB-like chromosome segregation protein Spo0J
MKYEQIPLKEIVQGSPDDELYVFTFRPDLTELQTSIERSGLLVAPVLEETETGFYRVICGSSRIKVLRHLGRESVGAFVVTDREWSDAECLSRSILENRWHRGFNEVEKALVFTRLEDRFPHLLPRLAGALGDDLKMPREPKALAAYRFILTLAEPIREGLARDELSLGQALLLRGFPAEAHGVFFRAMTECGLTLQESRKAAQWTLEAAAREGKGTSDFLEEVVPRPVLSETTSPQQKAQRLFSALRNRRYPLIESWNARFASARSQISARDKGIHVTHDPTFETTRIKVQIQATSAPELRKRLETLSEAAREGKIEGLFQALSVDSRDVS